MPWEALGNMFEDGDILYGLDQPRAAARQAITDARRFVERQVVFCCCFRRTKRYDRIVIQNDITNSVFDPMQAGLRTSEQIQAVNAIKSDPERAVEFRNFVAAHPKYSVANYAPGGGMDAARGAWLKTSKAGLAFQARRGGRIHFILDGLDYDRVLAQDDAAGQGGTALRRVRTPLDITSAEVRWLFRNRADAAVRNSVLFWLNGAQVGPPWESAASRYKFANFLYSKDRMARDDGESAEFRTVLSELRAAVLVQRAFRNRRKTYYVLDGDTIESIAGRFGLAPNELRRWNNLLGPNAAPIQIRVGQVLRLTDPATPVAPSLAVAAPMAVNAVGIPVAPQAGPPVRDRIAFWEAFGL